MSPISTISFFKKRVRRPRPGRNKGRAEVGAKPNARSRPSLRAEPVDAAKQASRASGLVHARSEPPGRDQLVADIFLDLAASVRDGERNVSYDPVEQGEEAQFAEPFGDRGDARRSMERSARSSVRGV